VKIIDMLFDEIKVIYLQNGWDFSEDINIFGLRNNDNIEEDIFNDYICISIWGVIYAFKATTDPGKWYTKNHSTGASHMCYGLHKKIWMVGTHGRKNPQSPALIGHWRCKKSKMWYDKNRDGINNDKSFGYEWAINCHTTMRDDPKHIGKASAGCQVLQSHEEFFKDFMPIVMSSESYRNKKSFKFDYALLDIKQLDKKFIKELRNG
jgi:hypothetical protein